MILRVLLAFVIPVIVSANIEISEIMYDLPGSDENREWVEVVNFGELIDFSTCKFADDKGNHRLIVYQGSFALNDGDYAVIAVSPEVFLGDWPEFSGNLYDSGSFSLNNTGETISVSGCFAVSLSYKSSYGGNGTGESLQKINEALVPSKPTPGRQNIFSRIIASTEKPQNQKSDLMISENEVTDSLQDIEKSIVDSDKSVHLEETIILENDARQSKMVWYGIMVAVLITGVVGLRSALKKTEISSQYKIIEESEE